MSSEYDRDPREVLAREKFFTVRPQPLEKWLWRQSLPPSAERVFWLHWQAGMQSGDWCSSIPLKVVARECAVDVSSVTRAYQLLAGLGLIRRQDPGRDPARPFQQAVAITEVRLPRELVQELGRHPDRTRKAPAATLSRPPALTSPPVAPAQAAVTDPFAGMRGRDRMRALSQLTYPMSPAEKRQFDEACRTHSTHIQFDEDSKLTPEGRARVLQFLACIVPKPVAAPAPMVRAPATDAAPRRLTALELARLRRELQTLSQSTDVEESFRQVVWSVEEGALRRFTTLHAVRIALKKLREGQWTRPNRMPPQWSRMLSRGGLRSPGAPEACTAA